MSRAALPGLSEAAFQAQVIALARLHRWRVAHFRKVRVQRAGGSTYWETPAAADGAGWPDLILCKGDRLVAAELKAGGGRLTPGQAAWLDALRAAGAVACVWRPADWAVIEAVLSGAA